MDLLPPVEGDFMKGIFKKGISFENWYQDICSRLKQYEG